MTIVTATIECSLTLGQMWKKKLFLPFHLHLLSLSWQVIFSFFAISFSLPEVDSLDTRSIEPVSCREKEMHKKCHKTGEMSTEWRPQRKKNEKLREEKIVLIISEWNDTRERRFIFLNKWNIKYQRYIARNNTLWRECFFMEQSYTGWCRCTLGNARQAEREKWEKKSDFNWTNFIRYHEHLWHRGHRDLEKQTCKQHTEDDGTHKTT